MSDSAGKAGRRTRLDAKEMPFLAHLEELRRVLIKCVIALAIAAAASWVFSGLILDTLVVRTAGEAKFIGPTEAFGARLKVTVMCGLLVGLPFMAYWIWGFVVPGLLESERRFLLPLVVSSTVLFYLGVAFSYFALTPIVVKVLLSFGTEFIRPEITISPLLGLILRLALACGILFQLPLVLTMLSYFGIVSPRWLKEKWRYAVVGSLILGAVATPADAASQLILAGPIILLYFVSIYLSALVTARKRRKQEAEEGEEA